MRYIIIDGYNVLRAARQYAAAAEADLESARARLLSDVAAYVGPGEHATVVFDGGANPHSDGTPHELAGIEVRFSPYGTDADAVIEDIVARRRAVADEVVLVTSDQEMQWVALGPTVTRRSSAEFASELVEEQNDRSEYAVDGRRTTLDARIDARTRHALGRWARGQD